jgi:all-trans-8'-apo-beta-carotenal 15,15'-oxygenase
MQTAPIEAELPLDPHQVIADAFAPVSRELDVDLEVTGRLPDGLDGVLFRNGPGALEMGADRYMHPFDGDGMIVRFDLSARGVRYQNRFVATRERTAELRAGKMLHRAFGTNLPGGFRKNLLRLRFKNAANTNVIWHGGRLLALWEGGVPHRLDPDTLATRERFTFGGALTPSWSRPLDRLLAPELPFSAHPRIDPRTGDLFNFGTLLGRKHRLVIYRVDARGRLAERRFLDLDAMPFVHDFVLTPRYLVFFLPPVTFDVPRALLGLVSPVEAIHHAKGAPTRILVVPRDGGAPRTLETRGGFVFHFVNAFERDDEVVVDGARMDAFEGGPIDVRDPAAFRGQRLFDALPTRFRLDLARGKVSEQSLGSHPIELPTFDGRWASREHHTFFSVAREVWRVGTKQGDGPSPLHECLARTTTDDRAPLLRSFAPDLPGEPVFVPRAPDAPEGDGWLLSVIYRARARRSELVCLDARTLETVATARLPHAIPPGFHGGFVPRTALSS